MGTQWQPGWGRPPPYDDWSLHIPKGLALTLRSRWAWEGVQGQGAPAVGGDLRLGSGPLGCGQVDQAQARPLASISKLSPCC